jgi:hypothetical protein
MLLQAGVPCRLLPVLPRGRQRRAGKAAYFTTIGRTTEPPTGWFRRSSALNVLERIDLAVVLEDFEMHVRPGGPP